VFEILCSFILPNSLEDQIGPALQLLTSTVNHLPLRLFSSDESLMELSSEMFIMKNQIYELVNSKTVGQLYEILLKEGPQYCNPSSVISLCKIYSTIMSFAIK